MIYDLLTHIGVKKGDNFFVEGLWPLMDEAGIGKTMICSQLETIDNEYIYECAKKYPDRTLPFAVINPWDIDGEEQLEHLFRDCGFYGLKMNSVRYGYGADRHSVVDGLFKVCQKYHKCIVGHTQSDMFSVPDRWAEMAKSFPDVPVVMFHIGFPLMVERACELARDIPNLYVSTCGSSATAIKTAYDICGPEKMIFSTDAPFGGALVEVNKIKYVIKDEKDRELVFCKNAEKILNIK